jgi:TRAP-type mannitol/chloroaromatic compound transport system permease small subunit
MPHLPFVLPHWLYWSGLILFPAIAWMLCARQTKRGPPAGPSLFLAYLFWLCSGFLGIHRLYLKNIWFLVYIPAFALVIHYNTLIRDAREDVSRTRSAQEAAHVAVARAKPLPNAEVTPAMAARLKQAQEQEARAVADYQAMQAEFAQRSQVSRWLAILVGLMLLADAILLPGMVRRQRAVEAAQPPPAVTIDAPEPPLAGTGEDPTLGMHGRLVDAIEWLNTKTGEYVAYWAVISVFVYYYEVIGRYVFNSPTIWVHESMFLMYGMQYMISGAYAYRADQHVRVDVIYTKFSPRGKAIADIVTSVFFFIFTGTLLWTGARFALDSIQLGETSFAEWSIQYWPVKAMIPIGAALILLQGVAKLLKDVALLSRKAA